MRAAAQKAADDVLIASFRAIPAADLLSGSADALIKTGLELSKTADQVRKLAKAARKGGREALLVAAKSIQALGTRCLMIGFNVTEAAGRMSEPAAKPQVAKCRPPKRRAKAAGE